jgi:hypothetical protein
MKDETLIGLLCSIGGLIIGTAIGSVIILEKYDEATRKLELAKKLAILTSELANRIGEYDTVCNEISPQYNINEEG